MLIFTERRMSQVAIALFAPSKSLVHERLEHS